MCVRCKGGLTDEFNCALGLRQGCNLSHILFSLFINELTSDMETMVEVFLLLFADGVALMSDTVMGLKKTLLHYIHFVSKINFKSIQIRQKC